MSGHMYHKHSSYITAVMYIILVLFHYQVCRTWVLAKRDHPVPPVKAVVAHKRHPSASIFRRYQIVDSRVRTNLDHSQLKLHVFNRNLLIKLTKDQQILSDSHLLFEDKAGVSSISDKPTFYRGVAYENGSYRTNSVFGTVAEGQFQGFVRLGDDTYHIEPARYYWPHRTLSVAFRDVDIIPSIRNQNFRFTGNLRSFERTEREVSRSESARFRNMDDHRDTTHHTNRHKRSYEDDGLRKTSEELKGVLTCKLAYYVDPFFYRAVGRSSVHETLRVITITHKLSDDIYRGTDFNSNGIGDNFGFAIKEIYIVRDEASSNSAGSISTTVPLRYLENFKHKYSIPQNYENWACMRVALTHQQFTGSVVGLAYVGQKHGPRGICSMTTNSIMVSPSHTRRSPTVVMAQIMTHELGHSLGADHDEDPVHANMTECWRSDGGMYIMSQTVVANTRPNNLKFSICSTEQILPVLYNRMRRYNCFTRGGYNIPTCGNQVIESSEACDCGLSQYCEAVDHCCTPVDIPMGSSDTPCRYRVSHGAVCSPVSSPCCERDCTVTRRGRHRVCQPDTQCSVASVCNGSSTTCPTVVHKPDGIPCSGGLFCEGGECKRSVCHINNLTDCVCTGYGICTRCCLTKDGTCVSVGDLFDDVETDDSRYITTGDACNGRSGVCTEDHRCQYRLYDGRGHYLAQMFAGEDNTDGLHMWFRNSFYYIGLAILSVIIGVSILIRTYWEKYVDVGFEAKRAAKIIVITTLVEQATYSIREKVGSLNTRELGDMCTCEKRTTVALCRLMVLFPDTAVKLLYQAMEMSSSEDMAVTQLILEGCKIVRLFNLCDGDTGRVRFKNSRKYPWVDESPCTHSANEYRTQPSMNSTPDDIDRFTV